MAHGPAKGIGRWLFTTNHKDIDYHAWIGHGVRRNYAGIRWSGELDDSSDDWCARYGVAADEQSKFLDSTVRIRDPDVDVVYGRRRSKLRLDLLRASVHNLRA